MSNSEKRSGESPARWHKKTAMVWLKTLRSQRERRCQRSRAQTFYALYRPTI